MAERIFINGNEAAAWGAYYAGCLHFFGYPITPQNEITEWFARELPKRGGVYVQTQSEIASINMAYGATFTGVRAMTSTAGPGWGLMQEGMSYAVCAEAPCVVILLQRGGPGGGTTRHGQMDYLSATWGGGQGGYRNIVLAPYSAQELHDFTQLAFYLADKYRNPTIVMTDGILGQMMEVVEMRTIDFGPLPDKDWAVKGKGHHKDGKRRKGVYGTWGQYGMSPSPLYDNYLPFLEHLGRKYQQMKDSEIRYDSYLTEDAELVIVAYGYTARVSKEAINLARSEGLKVGMLRPITLWPFPYKEVRRESDKGAKILVVEDSLGQLVEDVKIAVADKADEVGFLGVSGRHAPDSGGMILPERVLKEIKSLYKED